MGREMRTVYICSLNKWFSLEIPKSYPGGCKLDEVSRVQMSKLYDKNYKDKDNTMNINSVKNKKNPHPRNSYKNNASISFFFFLNIL